MTDSLSSSLLETIAGLAPLIEGAANESERSRRLALPIVEAMAGAGLFRLWLPRTLGGAEVDIATMVAAVEAVSRIDGATGWCMTIANNTCLPAGYLPSDAAREIYADDPLLVTLPLPARSSILGIPPGCGALGVTISPSANCSCHKNTRYRSMTRRSSRDRFICYL